MSARSSDPALAELLRHGGRLAAARAAFPHAPGPWIDLSTGINPRPYPARRAAASARPRRPDPQETAALEAAAARAFGVSPDRVAATPGTDAALRALPRVLGARSVAIAAPTYDGHAQAWRLAGAKVACVPRERLADTAAEAMVLVNPNNPDGAAGDIPDPGDRWLIVDEAFVETAPELSLASPVPPPLGRATAYAHGVIPVSAARPKTGTHEHRIAPNDAPTAPQGTHLRRQWVPDSRCAASGMTPNWAADAICDGPAPLGEHLGARRKTIILRSFGKFYGLPGVRLGFVIAEPGLAARIGAQFGDWPVSAEAIAAGLAAYADDAWAERTRLRLARDAARLDALLARAGFEIVGGTSLFRLAAAPDAQRRFIALARRGVLVRPFSDQPTWLRFGVPKPKDWPRLEAALEGLSP